ncbi:MAG: alpha-L-rhamnosidase N-terminal domain-containing protein [Oscillospiraceae bacterium]|nr:alpha-L-rhamnosidase N-terminal domain-containing protein [Oscillospiraceae bacterium]
MTNIPKYIWFEAKDTSRNPYAAFRKSFEVKNILEVTSAALNIFADTVYKLYVNGKFIGYGPVRFDPKYPQYDSYDLLPYLKNGANAIAVLVNFHGHKTFKNVPSRAAMIAWGKICESDSEAELLTSAKNWKCAKYAAHTRYTPKLSFALNAQIFYDQAKFDENWIMPDYDDGNWPDAVEIADQNSFGALALRGIPFMSMQNLPIAAKTKIFPLDNSREALYSFYIELPFSLDTVNPQTKYDDFVQWETYIYSPRGQEVVSAVLWDTVLVNGEICGPKLEDEAKPLRYNFVMSLNEGWNHVCGNAKIYQDIFELYLALPKNKGLVLSADKDETSGNLFRHTTINLKGEASEWVYSSSENKAESPCREASWDTYASAAQIAAPDDLNGFTFKKSLYPDGFTLIFDMEHMRLAFLHFVFSGVKGAVIDLLYADRYMSDNRHLRQQSWIPLGDRLVCSDDTVDWSPVQPRGFKYLNITVRNTGGDVTLENIAFISAHYPVDKAGSFECSDPALNNIWKMCALTQEINMEDVYEDCVDRERGLYTLDTLIQYHNNLACFGDQKLMKRSLELYAQSAHESGQYRCLYPNTGDYVLPDFSLYAVEAFYCYYLYTGDFDLIETWWDSLMTNLGVFNALSDERADCLLCADPPDKNNPHDRRTGHLGDGGWTNRTGVNCIFSCLYLIALRGACYLAGQTGKNGDFEALENRIKVLENSIPETFWSEERGLFADNSDMLDFSPHASLIALRAGAAGEDKLQMIKKNIGPLLLPFFKNGYDSSGGTSFSTSYAYYMLDSMYKAGLYTTAESCIKEGWGWVLSKGLKTAPEHWNLAESQCHAWAASPAYIMSRYILGVNFDMKRGLNEIFIDVKPGSVKWARGIFPHLLGNIEVSWHKDEDGRVIFDKVSAPAGVTVNF